MSVEKARNANGQLTAKAESQTLVKENLNRRLLIVCNFSAKEVWLSPSSKAEKEKGVWLKKESGSITLPGAGSPEGYTGEWTCITTEGEGKVAFAEI